MEPAGPFLIGSFQVSLKFWYSHESGSLMWTPFFKRVAVGKKKLRAAAILYPNIHEPYFGPNECTINIHRSFTMGLISLITTLVILDFCVTVCH